MSAGGEIELVYFIGQSGGGAIKIGRSKSPGRRLADLSVASPVALELLATTPGGQEVERELHKLFRDHHLRGEWFAPHSALLAFIERLKSDSSKQPELRDRIITPAERVICKCGNGDFSKGLDTIERWTGVHRSRLHRWTYPRNRGGTGGLIPAWHQQIIFIHARREDKGIVSSDFFTAAALAGEAAAS